MIMFWWMIQDFGTTELAIINKITKTGECSSRDVAQSVLPKRSLTDAGIELSGGRERTAKIIETLVRYLNWPTRF